VLGLGRQRRVPSGSGARRLALCGRHQPRCGGLDRAAPVRGADCAPRSRSQTNAHQLRRAATVTGSGAGPAKAEAVSVPSPGGKAPRGRCVRALVGRPRANRLALAGGRGAGGAALALDRVATGGAGADQVFLCDLLKELSLKRLVNTARGRWRMELDDQQRKEELGLDHFEGRSWTGGRHHVRLVMVAHLFLPLEQQQRRSRKRKRDPARDAA
jgi:hypothetical protein